MSINDDILSRILQNPEFTRSFQADIESIKKSGWDKNEKEHFETMYIKGFWQMVTFNGTQVSVAELAKKLEGMSPDEKKKAIDGMGRSDRIIFREFEWQLLVNEWKKIDAGTAAVINANNSKLNNQDKLIDTDILLEKNREILNKRLSEPAESLKSLWNGIWWEIQAKAREAALKNPPKELQGISEKDISEGKFDNIVIADYAINYAKEITSKLSVDDQKKFSTSIDQISGILNRRPPKWPEIVETSGWLALWTNRDKIKSAWDKLIADGYNKQVVWDADTRTLIFRGNKWVKAIETAKMPPQEKIMVWNLSIWRDATTLSPERKDIERLTTDTKKLQAEVWSDGYNAALGMIATVDTAVISESAQRSENSSTHTSTLNQYKTAKQTLESALTSGNTKDRIDAIKSMKQFNMTLDSTRKDLLWENIRKSIGIENSQSNQNSNLEKLEGTLSNERLALERLETLYTQIGGNVEQIRWLNDKVKKEPTDNFDSQAQYTLRYMKSIWYDIVGQDTMEKVITSINLENRWKIAEIDLWKNPKLDPEQEKELVRSIARLSRFAPSMASWKNVDPSDEIIAYRQMTSANWKTSLQELMKTTEFQSVVWGNPERFQKYLYTWVDSNTLDTPLVPEEWNSAINMATQGEQVTTA